MFLLFKYSPSVCNLKRHVDEIKDSTEKLQLQLSRLMEQV